ncbi:NAD(P)-binding protein [Rhizoclosmatium globosum]|uniref:NAD(P)-binding protein n=1 Tax=Rhizoclosmatium globosum TaxID=329046 RepID=A0A1Y2D2C7_9FUNG|nr:NAD(P)-binding protein [Rhizoclosmatium globosum]|eukprot:ORY53274.1 NAD(P)-binding protein [Rhizoclosmatium globosum]
MKQVVFPSAHHVGTQFKEDPKPGQGEVRIKMGIYPEAPPFPCVVGYEVSGWIDAIGSDVPQSWKGKEVWYSDCVVTKPQNVSFIEAASIPVVYLTAWMLLVHMGGIQKNQTILIQNAGGGVGLAAIDIARHFGAITIGTASGGKHAFLKERGLDHAIDYRKQDFAEEVMKITNNKGGKLGFFGASSMQATVKSDFVVFAWIKIAWSMLIGAPTWSPFGVNLAKMFEDLERPVEWLKIIMDGTKEGWVRPYVDSVFDMEHVADAHNFIESRQSKGKVVIAVDPSDPVHDMTRFQENSFEPLK